MKDEQTPSRTLWWEEALPVLEDGSIETKGLYVPSGIQRAGLLLIRVINTHTFPRSRVEVARSLALCHEDYDEEEFTRSVRGLEYVGLLQFRGSSLIIEPTKAAMRFHGILQATHELRQRRESKGGRKKK